MYYFNILNRLIVYCISKGNKIRSLNDGPHLLTTTCSVDAEMVDIRGISGWPRSQVSCVGEVPARRLSACGTLVEVDSLTAWFCCTRILTGLRRAVLALGITTAIASASGLSKPGLTRSRS